MNDIEHLNGTLMELECYYTKIQNFLIMKSGNLVTQI